MTERDKFPFTADHARCLEQLEQWEAAIRNVQDAIGTASSVLLDDDPASEAWAADARARLRTLKYELRTEAERVSILEDRDQLNAAEFQYYVSAIQEASAHLTLNPNSTNGEEWRQQLGSALATIGYPLVQLKAKRDAAAT